MYVESSSVLYIAPTYTSSMQELIMQGTSCFWCKKNSCHVESNYIYILQSIWFYIYIVVNRFSITVTS